MFSLEFLYFWHALCYMLGSLRMGEKIISTGDFRTHLEEGDIYVQLKRGDQIIHRS